jgi:O-antigen ligase
MRKVAYILSLLFIATIPAEGLVMFSGFGTISRTVGFLAIGAWLASLLITRDARALHSFHLASIVFLLWNGLSYFWSVDPERTLFRLQTYVQLFILLILLWNLYRTPSAIQAGLQAYILGAFFSISDIVSNFISNRTISFVLSYERYSATGFNANDIAVVLALGLPISWRLIKAGQDGANTNRFLKLANYAYIPAALLTVMLTGSRTGGLISLVAFLYVLGNLSGLKLSYRILILLGLIGSFYFIWSLVPTSTLDRILGVGTEIAAGDFGRREIIWRDAVAVFWQHPLFGIGSSAYQAFGESIHNTFLGILVELGVVGFLWFAVILIILARNVWRLPRSERAFWLIILLVWAMGVFTLNWVYRKPTWFFLAFIISSSVIWGEPVQAFTRRAGRYLGRGLRRSVAAGSNNLKIP